VSPAPLDQLVWLVPPTVPAVVQGTTITITADAQTDWFRDPRNALPVANAPLALLPELALPLVFTARVRMLGEATFDAGALYVLHDEQHWLKFALERSPQGRLTLVSVRTQGTSDDANHEPIDDNSWWLRVAVDERSVALHASADGMVWHLMRYGGRLAPSPARLGLSAQSPTGAGMTATFSEVRVEHRRLAELRDGS
jgi:hypothetical protein